MDPFDRSKYIFPAYKAIPGLHVIVLWFRVISHFLANALLQSSTANAIAEYYMEAGCPLFLEQFPAFTFFQIHLNIMSYSSRHAAILATLLCKHQWQI